jgi:hypothetical protein
VINRQPWVVRGGWPLGVALFLLIVTGCQGEVRAQRADPQDPQNERIGRELLARSIQARGGALYTGIRTISATGIFTPFEKGLSQIPSPFENYIIYPDRERVEFGKGKKKDRRIQVNQGRTGWVYDGDAQTIKDQTERQIADYLEGTEFDLDRILRTDLTDPARKIRFAGREELRPGERADVVTIELGPERQVSIWLDRTNNLPITLIYEKSGGAGAGRQEVRFFQYVRYDGVLFPNIIDFYRDGVQESRVNYQSIRVNQAINEQLYIKPATIKNVR